MTSWFSRKKWDAPVYTLGVEGAKTRIRWREPRHAYKVYLNPSNDLLTAAGNEGFVLIGVVTADVGFYAVMEKEVWVEAPDE